MALCLVAAEALAQTGRIEGTVTDASTGAPLPGVSVLLAGTTQGSVTDADGYFVVLNVRPGAYAVQASYVGYTPGTVTNVRVNVGLTTRVPFALQDQTLGLAELVVAAERPIVLPDVSASVAHLTAEALENLPFTDVEQAIGLQAGFEPGLVIRGAGGDQVVVVVDGLTTTDPRGNTPFTGISYTAVDEVQVQTGGFNAEYGNVRSGLVNVVTKEAPRDRYRADVLVRYSAPSPAHFPGYGPDGDRVGLPNDEGSSWIRPYLDTTPLPGCARGVAYCGTWAWPQRLRSQYREHEGWDWIATQYNQNLPEEEQVTAEQLLEAFKWLTRKDFAIHDPSYAFDGTFGGPVPGLGRLSGRPRFLASYRRTQAPYLVPKERALYETQTGQVKLTADVARGMKLTLHGLWAGEHGLNASDRGNPVLFVSDQQQYAWDARGELFIDGTDNLLADWWYNPMDVTRSVLGGRLTHVLGPKTFYEVRLQRNATDYLTGAARPRRTDTTGAYQVVKCAVPDARLIDAAIDPVSGVGTCPLHSIALTEEPAGYDPTLTVLLGPGMILGGLGGTSRDSSTVTRWDLSFDLTHQVNRTLQVKTGGEFLTSRYDVRHGLYDPSNPLRELRFAWNRRPAQGALYAQARLEGEGMIATLGLRTDYFRAGSWYGFSLFDPVLARANGLEQLDRLPKEPVPPLLTLSPRLGVSFPVTASSKLYFNYGHFRQMLEPRALYEISLVSYFRRIDHLGDPDQPFPKTVAYELGFEQNLFDRARLRLAGFYRDLSLQPRGVRYVGLGGVVDYVRERPYAYGDVRGLELTLERTWGRWLQGFLNYTYLWVRSGGFGYATYYEQTYEQRRYEESAAGALDRHQRKPIPEPFLRYGLVVPVPDEAGLRIAGVRPLAGWRITLLGEWRRGRAMTWTGQVVQFGPGPDPRIAHNTRWRDTYTADLRLARSIRAGGAELLFFVDVTNVLNQRQMSGYGIWEGSFDHLLYYQSLHLPKDTFDGLAEAPYPFVPGEDRPGDYRAPGAAFDPIYAVHTLDQVGTTPIEDALYYDLSAGAYMTFSEGAWGPADKRRVAQVLRDKAYIDMPNVTYHTFLNPRDISFGMRLSW